MSLATWNTFENLHYSIHFNFCILENWSRRDGSGPPPAGPALDRPASPGAAPSDPNVRVETDVALPAGRVVLPSPGDPSRSSRANLACMRVLPAGRVPPSADGTAPAPSESSCFSPSHLAPVRVILLQSESSCSIRVILPRADPFDDRPTLLTTGRPF